MTERPEPGISHIDVSLRSLTLPQHSDVQSHAAIPKKPAADIRGEWASSPI